MEVQAASLPECCKELVVEVQAATLPEKLPEKLDIPHLMILLSHSRFGVYDAASSFGEGCCRVGVIYHS